MRTRSGYDVKVEVTGTEGSVATEANPTSFPLLRKDGHVGVGIATIEGWLDRFEETCEPQRDLRFRPWFRTTAHAHFIHSYTNAIC